MSKIVLDAAEYEKIMDFALLDLLTQDYCKRILSLLKTNFGFNLAAYTNYSKGGRFISYYSTGFSDEFMRRAYNIFEHDNIRDLALDQYASNTWNGIFYSQDADPFTYEESSTIAYLNENRMHYFAIMVVSKEPRINITLCKTDKEGPFSPREQEILQRIHDLLASQVQTRQAHIANRQLLEVISSYCRNKKIGFIITDEERAVLTYNETALSLIPGKLNLGQIEDIASYVFSLFEDKENDLPDADESELSAHLNGRSYTIEEIKLPDEEGKQIRNYLITIRKNKHHDNRLSLAASAAYGLTERETNVAELLISGSSNDDIAEQLHISVHTVKIHVSNLFRKLNVHTRMEAVLKLGSAK